MAHLPIEEQFDFRFSEVDEDEAARRAHSVVDWVKREFSSRRYEGSGRSLAMTWFRSTDFKARATQREDDPRQHGIVITDAVAYGLHDDAQNLVLFCDKVLRRPPFSNLLALATPEGQALLPGMDDPSAPIDRMFRLTLAWLFLHEQAHLFQNHGRVARELGGGSQASSGIMEEFSSQSSGAPLSGRAAAISHACELSADHEATILTLQLMIVADEYAFRPDTLWLFVAGLMCVFQRFFDEDRRNEGEEASGTHPLPSYRMLMAQRAVLQFVENECVREYAKGLERPRQVMDVVSHAMLASAIYWNSRYRLGLRVDDFLNGAAAIEEVPQSYRNQLHEIWLEARPLIEADHFGFGTDAVMDIPGPMSL